MAVPKKKLTPTRGAKRRTHYTVKTRALASCGHCGSPKVPHRVCGNCGFYNGREVMSPVGDKA